MLKDKLSLGAGTLRQGEDWVYHDLLPLEGIDVVHNLVFTPWPFKDEQFTMVHAIDVIEHLPNYDNEWRPMIIRFIEECHRILKVDGELYIQTPGYNAEFLWQDVTHVRGFHPNSFDCFDPSTEFGKTTGFYSEAKFSVRHHVLPNNNLRFWLKKLDKSV